MPGILSLIAFAITEAPQVGQLIANLVNSGRTQPTADEIAQLNLDESQTAALYQRLFPGQTPPTA